MSQKTGGGHSILEQIAMLRAFVATSANTNNNNGSGGWTDYELTDCLRKCSYNVERAAECLMTGQYKRSSSSSSSKNGNQKKNRLTSSNHHHHQPRTSSSMTATGSTSTTKNNNNNNNSNNKKTTLQPALRLRHPNNVSGSSKSTAKMPPGISSSATGSSSKKKSASPATASSSTSSELHRNSTATTTTAAAAAAAVPSTGWILCQRWISDAICTTRNGKIAYNEPVHLFAASSTNNNNKKKKSGSSNNSGTVRFRASHMEGHLPVALAAMLAPLACCCYSATTNNDGDKNNNNNNNSSRGIISLQAYALMSSPCTPMGGHVPLAITVSIDQPKAFFQLFAAAAAAESNNNNNMTTSLFWENNRSAGNKQRAPLILLAQAAFDLLQWAHYGDVPDFVAMNRGDTDKKSSKGIEATSGGNGSSSSNNNNNTTINVACDNDDDESNEEEEDIELKEDDFEEESVATAEGQEMDQSLTTHDDATLPETECPKDMKTKGIELRPYQKQALFWMIERENKASRQQLEDQLAFLAELAEKTCAAGAETSQSLSSPTNGTAQGQTTIICECGPVLVSEAERIKSKTLDGQVNPIDHPLWKRRFLASPDMTNTVSFYVNELLGVAVEHPPEPPKPCSGGILADSMGLGKTVMLMALMAHCKEKRSSLTNNRNSPTTTLVVAKLSLLPQWEEELRTKTSLSSLVYYGGKSVSLDDLQNVDVVVTTYGTVQGDFKRKNSSLFNYSWLRVILDEAHCIRNHRTVASKACCSLRATHRWCVSGTIIQNSLEDAYGIMKFLKHEPWSLSSFWKAAITKPMIAAAAAATAEDPEQEENKKLVLDRVRRLLSPIMLRRTKESLTRDGTPILSLPEKDTKTIRIELSESEREFYNAVLARSQSLFEGFVDSGKASTSYLQIFAMLQRLRQVCDHIGLTVQNRFNDREAKIPANTDLSVPISPETTAITSTPNDDAIEKQFLESLLSKFYSKPLSPRKKKREVGSEKSPSKKVKVIDETYVSQVAGMVASIVKESATHLNEECAICLEVPRVENAALTPCAHIYCRDCLVGFLQGKASQTNEGRAAHTFVEDNLCPDGECPTCNEMVAAKRIIVLERVQGTVATKFLLDSKPAAAPTMSRVVESSSERSSTRAVVRQILEQSVCGTESSKMKAIMDELDNVWRLDPRSKILIFSHYLGFLDLLEMQLDQAHIPFFRLDGSLNLKERMAVLEQFRSETISCCISEKNSLDDNHVQKGSVLLMSMSAGAEGLNLVSASSCFIVEPWWNLAKEDQCVNRIHRIGQTANIVRVRKFVVQDTVEERIVELQNRKKYVADAVYSKGEIGETGSSSAPRLGLEDFRLIFQRQ